MTTKKILPMFAAAAALPLVFAQGCGDDGMPTSDTADTPHDTASGEEECDSEIEGTIRAPTPRGPAVTSSKASSPSRTAPS